MIGGETGIVGEVVFSALPGACAREVELRGNDGFVALSG